MASITQAKAGTVPASKAKRPKTKKEQAQATRAHLLRVARRLFAKHGYGDVALEQVVAKAGVTRGALYHHFSGKRDLFKNVYEQVEAEVTQAVAEKAATAGDPWSAAQTGWRTFLDACRDQEVRQIVILDAPSVLGLEQWREIADRYGGALVKLTLEALMDQGLLERQPVEPLARMLLGSLIEGGIMVAESSEPERTRDEVGTVIERIMDGLRAG